MRRTIQSIFNTLGVFTCFTVMIGMLDAQSGGPRKRAPGAAFFSDMPEVWPSFVHLRMRVSMKVYEKGKEVGAVTLDKGAKLKLVKVNPDQTLEVEFAGFTSRVDHAATDFLELLKNR